MSTDHPSAFPPSDADGMLVREVAQRLRCNKSHVYRLIAEGFLRVLPGPGAKVVTAASYRAYLESAQAAS